MYRTFMNMYYACKNDLILPYLDVSSRCPTHKRICILYPKIDYLFEETPLPLELAFRF